MPPRIAILGWGSLLWEGGPEFDSRHREWHHDGPSLPLEFSRVSGSRLGALTLVVDPAHGSATTVAWCLSNREEIADAVADLRCREGCPVGRIARLEGPIAPNNQSAPYGSAAIALWAKEKKVDAVVWTALDSNFENKLGHPFSVDAAVAYVKALSPESKARAAEYIWRAPSFVKTALRKALEQSPWF